MKKDIIISGVGGQGILSIAAIIGTACLNLDLNLKQSEVHGMSQRGGDVMSNMRISDKLIASDLIPQGKADLIISVEPLEALRHLDMLSEDGWLVTNITALKNMAGYPDVDKILTEIESIPNHISINANEIAAGLKLRKSANVVVLGAASPFIGIDAADIEEAIKTMFGRKGQDIVQQNIDAFREGLAFTKSHMK